MDIPSRTPPTLFLLPHLSMATPASVEGQRFPAQLAPGNASRSHPDPNIDFSQFEPIGATPGYKVTNTIPYTEEYMLSMQRQIRKSTLASISYVGNRGLHLLVLESANPGDPALCLSLPGCGPNGENNVYTTAAGQVVNGTRGPLGPKFRQRELSNDHRHFRLQCVRSQRSTPKPAAAGTGQLYLQQVS
jgi:hypothetical protein